MRSLRSLSVVLLLFVLAGVPAAQAPQPQPQATTLPVGAVTVDEIKGEVTVLAPGAAAAIAPQRGQVLAAETTIEVGKGSALLHLEDGSEVLIKGHSRVLLKAPAQAPGNFLELLLGKIVAKVQKRLGNAPAFRMGTPTAVITVRGTRFQVEVNKNGKTYVEVYEGVVEVASLRALGQPVFLRPGYHTDVVPDHLPDRPSRSELDNEMERPGFGTGTEREGTQQARPGTESPSSQPDQERETPR
jgi:ferric-dicitrate binding protein FerR (iron transport regulator)